ncbi:MAG: cation:proton antiporter, partial [Nitrosopumilaceae archaeon]|nr:cation:proton antiporter [Nitrosopumilaceae archaeon]
IIGNVLAGIIVGPAFLALVHPIDEIELFVSIGVFFLFFLIGLEELDLPNLFRILRRRIFLGAGIAFLIPFVVATLFGIAINLNFIQSFAIASVIGASSLGVTAKILTDLGKLRSTVGLEIFTVTAIIEFIAIILTSVFIQIDQASDPGIIEFAWLFAKMILFFVIAGLLSVFGLPRLLRLIRKHTKVKQVYFGIVIGVILLVAYFAEVSGVHGAIGALLLGIAVSRMQREDYQEISKSVNVIGHGIFIPIFFAGIGLHFTISFFDMSWWIIVGFVGITVGVKFIASYVAVRISRLKPITTVAFGIMSKGAVDLALLLSLLEFELLDDDLFSLLVFGTLITLIVSSVELQRRIKQVIHVKVGPEELSLVPIFFRRAVSDLNVEDVIQTDYNHLHESNLIDDAINHLKPENKPALVFNDDEELVGLTSTSFLKKAKDRNMKNVGDAIYTDYSVVFPQDYLFSVIQKVNASPFHTVPVLAPDHSQRVIGVVSYESILKTLSRSEHVQD